MGASSGASSEMGKGSAAERVVLGAAERRRGLKMVVVRRELVGFGERREGGWVKREMGILVRRSMTIFSPFSFPCILVFFTLSGH